MRPTTYRGEEWVAAVRPLAEELGVSTSWAARVLRRHRVEVLSLRMPSGQRALAVRCSDLERVLAAEKAGLVG